MIETSPSNSPSAEKHGPLTVVHHGRGGPKQPAPHENVTRAWVATRLALLLGYSNGGEYDDTRCYVSPLYFVPGHTLVAEDARALGIGGEHDLFGGVIPHAFLGGKAIAHPLVEGGMAPPGWSHTFGASLGNAVLDGYSAFDLDDARRAGRSLLAHGDARVKPGDGIGGRGQTVVANAAELDAAIDALDATAVRRHGVVIEQNLQDVTTFSVGRVRVGEMIASYVGTQQLTQDNQGGQVYGGSDLTVARGDYDQLLAFPREPLLQQAVRCARAFDAAVANAYPGLFASRRNYDVAYGRDAVGNPRMGLLEQSWRMGGASPAEITALEAFDAHPKLPAVRVCCVEAYGKGFRPPPDTTVYFCGDDERAGPLTKFVYVKDDESAA